MRAFRIELRRSAAFWTGILTVVLSLGVFYLLPGPWGKSPDAWTEEWTSLAIWQRWPMNMLWPLALGAGAWQGRMSFRSNVDELLSATPKSVVRRAVPTVAALCVSVVGGYLVFFLVGAVQVVANASYHHLGWLPVTAVGALSLVAAVLAGLGIGRVLPYVLTAPILAVLAFVGTSLALVASPGSGSVIDGAVTRQFALMMPIFDSPDNPFLTVADRVSAIQGLWFLALAGTGLGLYTLVSLKARVLALVPAVAAGVLAVSLLPTSQNDVFTPDESAMALVCADGTPRVCVSRLHESELPRAVGPAREALTLLAKIPGGPASAVETRTSAPEFAVSAASSDTAYFLIDFRFPEDVRQTILAGPPRWRCESGEAGYTKSEARRAVVTAWLDGESRLVTPDTVSATTTAAAQQLWDEVRALPVDQQPARRRVTCRGT